MANNKRKGAINRSRHFGLEGAGKGDSDRTEDVAQYNENLALIPFHPEDKTGFTEKKPGHFVKKYPSTGCLYKASANRARTAFRGSRGSCGCSDS